MPWQTLDAPPSELAESPFWHPDEVPPSVAPRNALQRRALLFLRPANVAGHLLTGGSLSSVLDTLMQQHFPTLAVEAQFDTLWIFRLYRFFGDLETRCSCMRVRFLSICAVGECVI